MPTQIMDEKQGIWSLFITSIALILFGIRATTIQKFSYFSLLFILIPVGELIFNYNLLSRMKACKELGETLFLSQYGVNPEKCIVLSLKLSTYDLQNLGISKKSAYIKFLSRGKTYKGIIDLQNKALYMQEPVYLPVFEGNLLPLWRRVTKIHTNGNPKKIEFYDDTETPHRFDCLDDRGELVEGSWRRQKGIEEHWNPKKRTWESVP